MPDPAHWPRFCCAILQDSRGRYVLERRPPHEAHAPGRLTCFGGTREPGEDPLACLRRELIEELDFSLGEVSLRLILHTPSGQAWFYEGRGPEEGHAAAVESGYVAEWIAPEQLMDAAFAAEHLARWHRAMFEALRAGLREARVDR